MIVSVIAAWCGCHFEPQWSLPFASMMVCPIGTVSFQAASISRAIFLSSRGTQLCLVHL